MPLDPGKPHDPKAQRRMDRRNHRSGYRGKAPKNSDRYLARIIKKELNLLDPDEQPFNKTKKVYNRQTKALIHYINRNARKGQYNKKDQRAVRKAIKAAPRALADSDMSLGDKAMYTPVLLAMAERIRRAHRKSQGLSPTIPDKKGGGGKHGGGGGKHGGGKNGGGGKHGGRGKNHRGPNLRRGSIDYDPSNYVPDPNLRIKAANLVDSDINEQSRDILNLLRSLKGDFKEGKKDLRTQGKRERGDLRDIFAEVADATRANNKTIRKNFVKAQSATNKNYNQLDKELTGNATSQGEALMEELRRLGIAKGQTGRFAEDAANNANVADVTNNNLQGVLRADRTSSSAIGRMMLGAARGERASQIGQSINRQGDAIGDLRSDYREQGSELRKEILDLQRERGGNIQELLMALEDQDYQRWAEQNQQEFLNQMQVNAFNLDVEQMNRADAMARAEKLQELAKQRAIRRQQQLQSASRNILKQVGDIFSF